MGAYTSYNAVIHVLVVAMSWWYNVQYSLYPGIDSKGISGLNGRTYACVGLKLAQAEVCVRRAKVHIINMVVELRGDTGLPPPFFFPDVCDSITHVLATFSSTVGLDSLFCFFLVVAFG